MKLGKWIGGIMGFMAMGPLGALAGYAIGSLFDKAAYAPENMDAGNETYTGQRNSFLFSLLVMASYIIRADGKIMHSEMEFVRRFLRTNFGEDAVAEGEQILLNLFEQRKRMEATNPYAFQNTIRECGAQIAANMSYEERLQLLSFLAQIARSDGNVCAAEIDALKELRCINIYIDKQMQITCINTVSDKLKSIYCRLQQEVRAKSRIYQVLGVMSGVIIAIILI